MVIDIIWAETIQFHVWSPEVVPAFKLITQLGQMVEVLNDRHAFQQDTAQIIDFPANYHNAAAGFSFADGQHAVIHTWAGFKIKHAPVYYGLGGNLQLNVPAEDS